MRMGIMILSKEILLNDGRSQRVSTLSDEQPYTICAYSWETSNNYFTQPPVPPPVHLAVSAFNVGTNPGGKIQFSTGEPWESQYVYFTNVTVVTSVNTSRGTFMFTDGTNQLSDYDGRIISLFL